jgi:hypothetical protein
LPQAQTPLLHGPDGRAATTSTPAESPSLISATPPAALATAPPRVETPSLPATSLSIRVMHYHRVGYCIGHLVATRAGLAFVPDSNASRDGFDFKYTEFVHVAQDDTLTIKSSARTYRFKAMIEKGDNDPTIDQFETRISRWK